MYSRYKPFVAIDAFPSGSLLILHLMHKHEHATSREIQTGDIVEKKSAPVTKVLNSPDPLHLPAEYLLLYQPQRYINNDTSHQTSFETQITTPFRNGTTKPYLINTRYYHC